MRRSVEVGLAAALAFGAACGGSGESESVGQDTDFLPARVLHEVTLYDWPNDIDHPTGQLRVGEIVGVECHFLSYTLGMDSVKVSTGGQTGFAFVGSRDPEVPDSYEPNFDPDLLVSTPGEHPRPCKQGLDYGPATAYTPTTRRP